MAEKKNFTIENYNGTDYDTLYPETNSGQVLLDSEAQTSTGLESGKTLDDALNHIYSQDATFKVGDTLTTSRTNLGDKWLLCNDDFVANADYPELSNTYPTSNFNWKSDATFVVNDQYAAPEYLSASDTQVAVWRSYTSGGSLRYYRYIINDFSNPDSFVYFDDVSIARSRIKFVNNYWFSTFGSNFSNYTLKYCIGDIVSGDSFSNTVAGSNYFYYDVFYDNGKYYGLADGVVNIWTDLNATPVNLSYSNASNNDTLFFKIPEGLAFASKVTSGSVRPLYIISEDNTLTEVDLPKTSYGAKSPNYLCYFNGYYYICGPCSIYRYNSLSNEDLTNYTQLYYNNDDSTNIIPTITDDYIVFSNGYYVGKDNQFKAWDNSIASTANIFIQNGEYKSIVVDEEVSSTVTMTLWKQPIADSMRLPSVSVADNLYTYIKAK